MTPLGMQELFTHGYVLIDPLNFPAAIFSVPVPMLRCTPSSLANIDELMPRLVNVERLASAQRNELIEFALDQAAYMRPPGICAWLIPACTESELVRHLASYLIAPTPGGNDVLWRYFDPRVFSLAMLMFLKQQRDSLLCLISEWRFIWCRQWWSVAGALQRPDPLFDHDAVRPTAAQWRVMARSALVAQILRRFDRRGAMPASTCLVFHQRVIQALDQAEQQYKLKDEGYLAEYAFLRARYGAAFVNHFRLVDEWRKLESGESSWPEIRDRLRPGDMQCLEEQLSALSYLED